MGKGKVTIITLLIVFLLGSIFVYGDIDPGKDRKGAAYLREDITVEFNREILRFKDAVGNTVYPLTYNGSTYLPMRAVSGLMGEPIEWEPYAKTVYIGKTISSPVKQMIKPEESPYVSVVGESSSGAMTNITVQEKRSIFVMYDFEMAEFRDENGTIIYPINYKGSNYLPLRAVAELMGEEIEWDGRTKTIYIGSLTPIEEEEEVRDETMAIIGLYDKEAELYNLATNKISGISKWTEEEKHLMAAAISADSAQAQRYKREAKDLISKFEFNEEEEEACQKLYEFIEITEHYILVMENIAYMAAAGEDYSVVAETFLYFALESDSKMNSAKEAIECL